MNPIWNQTLVWLQEPMVMLGLKTTLLLGAVELCLQLGRRWRVEQRLMLLMAGMGMVVVMTLCSGVVPTWQMKVLPSPPRLPAERGHVMQDKGQLTNMISPSTPWHAAPEAEQMTSLPVAMQAPGRSEPVTLQDLLLGVWLIGAALVAMLWGKDWLCLHRLYRRSAAVQAQVWQTMLREEKARFGIRRMVRLRLSERVDTPMTWGWWRPVIVLPRQATAWSDLQCRMALHMNWRMWGGMIGCGCSCAAYSASCIGITPCRGGCPVRPGNGWSKPAIVMW